MENSINQIKVSIQNNNFKDFDIIKFCKDSISSHASYNTMHEILEIAHMSQVSSYITKCKKQDIWLETILEIAYSSNFHTGYLLKQRSQIYKHKIALKIIKRGKVKSITYSNLWNRVIELGKSLWTLNNKSKNFTVGLLTPNNLNAVVVDLACLSFGHRVIPIPINSTTDHISYILNHSEVTHLFIGGKAGHRLWSKVQSAHKIEAISLISEGVQEGMISWDEFIENGDKAYDFDLEKILKKIDMNELQTIMYTSGTTSKPKGITFSQYNIISKRFARAIALPDITNDDTFLCFLPLYHTFGRYFELLGSIFWGATYTFAESPAFSSLLSDFKLVKPTIFISIPKRWVQLYELLENKLDLTSDKSDTIRQGVIDVTGGNLSLGLSAAGYLDPDIFLFFQKNNINLLSGYGMTEATGGITMTPTNDYVKNSLGKALPGIELKLKEDGELCIKGPYVTSGYYKVERSKSFKDGWFYTGDIFEKNNGHYFIIDRKKDIYKNSRGQTISPQKIENLFQDFEQVKSVFLVGDGKEFNSVLIYPSKKRSRSQLSKENIDEIRDLFGSMIISVNSFLSPYERIINYVVINRDFTKEKGELTQKGTYVRKRILNNFKSVIDPLYEKNYFPINLMNKEIRIPNWIIREIGTVNKNIKWEGRSLMISNKPLSMPLNWTGNKIQIGDFHYTAETNILDLDMLIQCPSLWLGNEKFVDFVGVSIFRLKEPKPYNNLEVVFNKGYQYLVKPKYLKTIDTTLYEIHRSVRLFLLKDRDAFKILQSVIDENIGSWSHTLIQTFSKCQNQSSANFRIKLIEVLSPILGGEIFISMFRDAYINKRHSNNTTGLSLDIKRLTDEHYHALIDYIERLKSSILELNLYDQDFIKMLLFIVADFGIEHPTRFFWARSELISWQLIDAPRSINSTAQKAYYSLIKGFRSWIGRPAYVTVDSDTSLEYNWNDVVVFDDNIRYKYKGIILKAIIETSLIRESVFLFSKNYLIDLNDIPREGIWIKQLGNNNKKCVFRVLIKTRNFGTHNIALNINEGWAKDFFDEETKLLINMGSGFKKNPLVENFGGYWPEYQIYTEEYISGETVERYLYRCKSDIEDNSKVDRWQMRWLHFIWNGIQAYQEFWGRTNYKLSIQPPTTSNLIIPKQDYKTGTRIISISNRGPIDSLCSHFLSLYTDYIIGTERKYAGLSHMSDWEVIFTATIQALNVERGTEILRKLKLELASSKIKKKCDIVGLTPNRLDKFLSDIDNYGVLTKPVVFASLRYQRWLDLNQNATKQAKASIIQELYKDYELNSLLDDYPETRVRFFMMTCFKESSKDLSNEFQTMIKDMREKRLSPWKIQERISTLQSNIQLSDEERFFLAKMLLPNANSAEYVELVTTTHGAIEKLNLVTQMECEDGEIYQIRPPFLPKEIAQFHSLLKQFSLSVIFTSEHEFLFAFNNRNRLIGGLFWKSVENDFVHLEWVVIKERYRKINISKKIMDDFFDRMVHLNISYITVGFYAQDFFSKYGFKIDKQYGGMVKKLS